MRIGFPLAAWLILAAAPAVRAQSKPAKGDEGTVTVMIGATPPFKFQAVRVES